ncbi:MAG: FtsH protease activity modulator HflK [Deferrisomatales bacterium]|nr:FtsH protease activity modulator HflK [Deferrisomatales bacterium]
MSWKEQGGFGGGPRDPMEILEEIKGRLRGKFPAGGAVWGIIVVALLVWAATGIYIVNPDEVGVVKRFGKYAYTTGPGPHWHIPYPVESVLKPKVTQVRRVEVGFRTVAAGPPARYQRVPAEALMLTGDENIVSCEFIVQYRVRDAQEFLFRVRDPDGAVRAAAEAAMREIVGRNIVDDVLTEQREMVQVEAAELLQSTLDIYRGGIRVDYVRLQDVYPPDPVIDAFRDVASAREDRERLRNEAEAYANDIIPKSRGEAAERLNQALGYRATKIASAEGDAARFQALLAEYEQAKDITRRRLYLDAMGEVLSKAKIVLSDGKQGAGVLPVLPLDAFAPKEVK